MAKPVTKYLCTLMDPSEIRFELEKAWAIATTGRPGPVWINIPLDVQGAVIEESSLRGHEDARDPLATGSLASSDARHVMSMLGNSRRPVLIPGNGVHLARATRAMQQLIERLQIPVALTLGSMDVLEEAHPCNVGRFGPIGQRRANFVVQNADLILAVGTSM